MRVPPPLAAAARALLLGLAVALAAAPARAEEIRLRNGQLIRGKIVRETKSGILVRLDAKSEIHLRFSEIAEIRREGEVVSRDDAVVREADTRDRARERAIIREYTAKFELLYRQLHPELLRIPYEVRQEKCDPVHVARRYGLPVTNAASSEELRHMFELALRTEQHHGSDKWRRTLAFYGQPRELYIRAIEANVELANIYLDYPDLPTLLNLRG